MISMPSRMLAMAASEATAAEAEAEAEPALSGEVAPPFGLPNGEEEDGASWRDISALK